MKKLPLQKLVATMLSLLIATSIIAQPAQINYQGVARNAAGTPIANQAIGLRFTIQDSLGNVYYKESATANTNAFGLFTSAIGVGTPITNTMAMVPWIGAKAHLAVEIDPAGGSNYTSIGSPTKLLAVPYALAANSVAASNNSINGGLRSSSASNLWWGIYENNAYRGYIGSYSGKNEDVDFGTGTLNSSGSVHLTIQAVPKLTVDSSGKVGIGTQTPQTALQINSGTGVLAIGDQGGWTALGLANYVPGAYNLIANGGSYLSFLYSPSFTTSISSSNSKMLMDGAGSVFRPTNNDGMNLGMNGVKWQAVYATNGTIQTSDERYKTNMQPLTSGLNTVMQLHPISYSWKNEALRLGTGINYGFSAQELSKVAPDLVIHSNTPIDKETGKIPSEFPDAYGVKYAEFTPILVKAIQEQQAIITQLQQQVLQLQTQIQSLLGK